LQSPLFFIRVLPPLVVFKIFTAGGLSVVFQSYNYVPIVISRLKSSSRFLYSHGVSAQVLSSTNTKECCIDLAGQIQEQVLQKMTQLCLNP